MSASALMSVSARAITSLALLVPTVSCNRGSPSPSPASSADPTEQNHAAHADSNQVHDSTHPLDIAVTSEGFVPARARVKVGEPVTLAVTRTVERTCATEIVIKEYGINKPLPHGQRVDVTFTPTKPGPIRYACAMDMVAGVLVAE